MPYQITVLVVEDEPLIRMEIAGELSERGFAVIEASNSVEAIGLLESHPEIEVLFTDVDMPGSMDGLMLAAAVRDRWPPIKIIVTSGHQTINMGDIPVEGRFFDKPYQPDVIASAVREMMAA